jgi:hypothetical protein
MIDEKDFPSMQFKVSLRGPNSIRKVDGPSLILIDFYVPALKTKLDETETRCSF